MGDNNTEGKVEPTPKPQSKVEDTRKIPEWHPQQEKILKKWSEVGASYRYLHDKAFLDFEKQNMGFALPVIIISTLTGTANFAQGSFPESSKEYAPLIIGLFNIAAGLITTIAQFLRVSELMESHRSASLQYSKFSRNLAVELSLPVKERTMDGRDFLSEQRKVLDKLIEQSPSIPEGIVKRFGERFKEKDSDGNTIADNAFFKPEILQIKPVDIYEKTKLEEEQEEHEIKVKMAEFERKRTMKILEEDEKRKKQFEQDFFNKLKKHKELQDAPKPAPAPRKLDTVESVEDAMKSILQEIQLQDLDKASSPKIAKDMSPITTKTNIAMDIEEVMSDTDSTSSGDNVDNSGADLDNENPHTVIDVADDVSGNQLTEDDKKIADLKK